MAGYSFSSPLTFNNGKTLTSIGNYIAKYDSSGTCQWAERIGGSNGDYAYSIALDASGNVYVAGDFKSSALALNNGITLTKSGSTSYSDGYIAKYRQIELNPPTLISPSNASTNISLAPTLTWNVAANATNYRVQLSTSNTFATLLVNDVVAATSKSLSGLANNTQYYWRVKSLNASDSSDWSEVWSFTTEDNGVSVKDDATSTLTITPQPATTEVMLNLGIATEGEVEVRLFNQAGQLMLQVSEATANGIIKLNTSDLPSGVYQAMISAGGSVQTARIVIVR